MTISKIDPAGLDVGQIGGRRNLIINGAMQVAQRGTSFSSISSDEYTLDRFIAFHTSVTPTITQETLSVGQTDLPSEFRNYLRFAASTGAAFVGFGTRIEDVSKYYGTYKLSFYAKGTNPTGGSFQQRMIQRFGSGGSSQVITDNDTFTVTSSWQRFEIDVTVPSVSGKTVGTGSYLQFQFTQPSSDSGTDAWTLDITGVQLEVGTVATPFEHRSYGEELALCQRYFYRVTNESDSDAAMMESGSMMGAGECVGVINHPVVMRAKPTYNQNDTLYFRSNNGQTLSASPLYQFTTTQRTTVWWSVSGTAGLAGYIRANTTNLRSYTLDAEL